VKRANERECAEAGIDPSRIESLVQRFDCLAREARALGLTIFGGSGLGSLRFRTGDHEHALILAGLEGPWDGGDGGCFPDDRGLLRGES